MLSLFNRLVDGRTECKTAGGAAGEPIKDVMSISRPGREPRRQTMPGMTSWRVGAPLDRADVPGAAASREILIEEGARHEAGGGGSPTVNQPGND